MASEPAKPVAIEPLPNPVEGKAVPPAFSPNIDHIVTEDDEPVDNIFSEKQQRLLTEPLFSSWQRENGRSFVALANVGLFFAVREPPYVPDMLLSLNVELPESIFPKGNRSYFVWEYGKPPEVVVEIVSNREGREDSAKLDGYAQIGVRYYIIFDPEHHLSDEALRGYQLVGLDYQPLQERMWLPGVELELRLWDGSYEGRHESWLRWYDPNGNLIATGAERADQQRHRADKEAQRADTERQRADEEKRRADHEKQRADSLAEQLRQLGNDPET